MAKAKPSTPRRGRPVLTEGERDAVRARIVAAAGALFQNEGYRAISMRRLASEAGCAPMTLYAYFADKADILRHIWAQVLNALFADLERTAQTVRDPVKRLRAISRGYVDYWLAYPDDYRMVFMTEGVSQPEVAAYVSGEDGAAQFALFAKAMADALGKASSTDLKLRTDALICGLHGVAHNAITIGGYPWAPAPRLVDLLVDGVLA